MKPIANSRQRERGLDVARLLTGAWRESPGSPDVSEDRLAAIAPLLCQSGAGALGWWRVRNSSLAQSAAGQTLHEVYRRFRLSALIHEREIEYVFSLLRAEGIEAVLVKGWAIARLYPDRALRPYGDIDLCVRPSQFAPAAAALKCLESIAGHHVDLHDGFDHVGMDVRQTLVGRDRSKETQWRSQRQTESLSDGWDDLFSRSQLVPLKTGTIVRVFSPEDHLRLLCLHLLRSGLRRPPWLCDVALLVESRGSNFNWSLCLGRDSLHADWVACAIGLAHQLLGVDVKDTPVAERAQNLPRWLVPAVLRQWGTVRTGSGLASSSGQPAWGGGSDRVPGSSATMRESSRIATIFTDLCTRWDNPVRATAAVRGQFNNWPRLPYRLAESIMRIPELPKHLAMIFRQRQKRKRRAFDTPIGLTNLKLKT